MGPERSESRANVALEVDAGDIAPFAMIYKDFSTGARGMLYSFL